jgi:hypothetical protein
MLVIFYGNCQVVNLNKFLKLENHGYEVKTIDCTKTTWDISKLKRFIGRSVLIIMTYIKPNYRDRVHLSSQFIVQHANPKAKVIIVPCTYFPLYHHDGVTIKLNESDMFKDPDIHHYGYLLKSYIDGHEIEYYKEKYINNKDLYSLEELENIAKNGIMELTNRQNEIKKLNKIRRIYLIKIDQFIENNYKDNVLFHTYNHPTSILYLHIVDQINHILNIDMSYINKNIDPLAKIGKMYIYDSIRKILNFDVDKFNNEILKQFNGNLDDMIKTYYVAYRKTKNKKYIEYYKKYKMIL